MINKELENKLDEENYNIRIYDYGCLNQNSKPQCKTCDGFGRNSDIEIEVEKCYVTKQQMKEDLGLNKNN